jgi:hypothetical protein
MYFPIGWPQTLKSSEDTISIVCNTDRSLFGLLTINSLSIWFCRPSVRIVEHKRDNNSLVTFGQNVSMVWRPDSTIIVVQTNQNYLLFYQLIIQNNSDSLLQQKDVE